MIESTGSIECPESRGINQAEIQSILAGPDYFTCERTHTRMKKEECIVRQTRGIKISAIGNYREVPPECEECQQGKRILTDAGGDQKEEEMTNLDRKTQSNRGKTCSKDGCNKPAVVKGLCKTCYDMQWRREHPLITKANIDEDAILLHFGDHPNMFGKIEGLAKEEFRTIEGQIMYLIRKSLED